MIKIAMIEDDTELADVLTQYLAKYNIEITNYEDPYLALSAISLNSYDLIILDLTLPGMDGLEVCKKLLLKHNIPIIISSARSDITDKVIALELGADDYLPKPYDPRELEVRIKTILRRCSKELELLKPEIKKEIFSLDEKKQEIMQDGKSIRLTAAEYEILSLMIKRRGFVVSRYDILQNCTFLNDNEESGSLAVIINRIRAKIEQNPKNPKYLLTIRGLGYKLAE
ncbi:MAG: DNA-binding response regulator [Sulfurimonas sp. RIFOXYD12_FULL_33_39]|uniref:response regulator transcription factor n=1 Tax=unclassified Sulfurimonas TaxID=2623549 RepID=UPI0008C3AA93|nr:MULTISPECIES: response regulator transcription factor [unclassified Sulfurimonas]OHE09702.1 MAG: DNA-binding response regulator [Sulfurimonas sp. RIFOXYD12_FULL_33_39]OHE13790.1 MAG: DNA-binding response regulator [Sulfurimonas sp. RIFOXYD2_FULL_34_21]